MALSAPFGSVSDADSAYYGSTTDDGGSVGDGGGDDGSGSTWGELQSGDSLGSGWTLAYQDQTNGDRQRWFAIRKPSDSPLEAIKSSGEVHTASDSDTLADLPHYDVEDDARAAYQAWAENNGEETENPDAGEWGEWQNLTARKPWHIFTRSHSTDDRQQFLIAGKTGDGTVYLAPGGTVQNDPHVYDSSSAVTKALEAYFQAVEDGELSDGEIPNGDTPSTETVRKEAKTVRTSSQSSQKVKEMVEKLGGKKVAIVAVAGLGAVAYQRTNGGT